MRISVCSTLFSGGKRTRSAKAGAASIHLSQTAVGIAIEIADDGVGGADATAGTGLRGLADRVEALDGRLRVGTAPGGGTCVRAEIPVDQKPVP